MALYRKEHYIGSAIALSYAAVTRIFPAVFMGSLFLAALYRSVYAQTVAVRYRKFFITSFVTCSVFFLMGGLNADGLQSWLEFKSDIELHNTTHMYGNQRCGLKHLFTHPHGKATLSEVVDKELAFSSQKKLCYVSAGILLALYLVTVVRKDGVDAMVWGLIVIFTLLVSSRYYWSIIILLSMLNSMDGKVLSRLSAVLLLMFIVGFNVAASTVTDWHGRYIVVDLCLFIIFIVLMIWEIVNMLVITRLNCR
jgi:hypothetical protein